MPIYNNGIAVVVGGRFISGPRGSAILNLDNISINGPLYGIGIYSTSLFSFGGGGAIYLKDHRTTISNVNTGMLIGFDPYSLSLGRVSSIFSDTLYVNVSMEELTLSNIDRGVYIGRVLGEKAFYNISFNNVFFETPASIAGFIVNNTSPYKSMLINLNRVKYAASPPYTSSLGLISYGEYTFRFYVGCSVIGSFIIEGTKDYDVLLYETVYDEIGSLVSPIVSVNSAWTLGVFVVDKFSNRPVDYASVKIMNSTGLIGSTVTNTFGYASIKLTHRYDSSMPLISQLVINVLKNFVEKSLNYTLFEDRYTLPSWYRNITIKIGLGVVRAMVFGDLGIGYLVVEGYRGNMVLGSLLSNWLIQYNIIVHGRTFISDILVLDASLIYRGNSLRGVINVNLANGLIFIRFGGLEFRGYIIYGNP